ncbi:Uncharacterised protein [Vibrio cholerae]|nr:Uncharacterised protein [Vibrio cholerae]CSI55594.1 Uncharacterised protein [Vibrio cholerae]
MKTRDLPWYCLRKRVSPVAITSTFLMRAQPWNVS